MMTILFIYNQVQVIKRKSALEQTNKNNEVNKEAFSCAISSLLNESCDRLRMPFLHWIS